MLKRDINGHKGQNGKVLVIGGSKTFYGAPIMCALGAEASGVDLVYLYLPKDHVEAAKSYSLNFVIHSFYANSLGMRDVEKILKLSPQVDTVVIGPGIIPEKNVKEALKNLYKELRRPTVIDAGALLYTTALPTITVLTPHRGEFKELTGQEPTPENIQKAAKDLGVTIVCKGPTDIIANRDTIALNETGHPAMTVGGTGDVLAGFIGGLIARGQEPLEAAETATNIFGLCGEQLGHLQENFTAYDLAKLIPQVLYKNLAE